MFFIGLYDAIDVSSHIADLEGTTGVADAQVGIGLWLTCLAGLLGVAGSIGSFATSLKKS